MSKKEKVLHIHRLSLIHQTDKQSAESIISSQLMKPGAGGLYGPGIYFANTIEACEAKALRKGVFLIADVYLGKVICISKNQAIKLQLNKDPEQSKNFQKQGYNSIQGCKQKTGREFIVFDSERIKNIRYIYGERPTSFYFPKYRYVLFWVASRQKASQIVSNQSFDQYDGPFGEAFYLFDSITDAQAHLGQQETYLAADVYMKDKGELRPHQTLSSPKLPRRFQTFVAKKEEITFYIIRNPEYIINIHYCGGLPWNK